MRLTVLWFLSSSALIIVHCSTNKTVAPGFIYNLTALQADKRLAQDVAGSFSTSFERPVMSVEMFTEAERRQPELVRLITEDSYKGDITTPLSLNLFIYVGNNPINFIDPTGHLSAKVRTYLFGVRHPIIAGAIGKVKTGVKSTNISAVAVRFATNDLGLSENAPHEGSQVNAYRHALWQAMITARFGKSIAKEVGDAHEEDPDVDLSITKFDYLTDADQSIDLLNNQAGRAIGKYFDKNTSRKSIALATIDYYYETGLYVAHSDFVDGEVIYRIVLEKLSSVY